MDCILAIAIVTLIAAACLFGALAYVNHVSMRLHNRREDN